MIRLTPFLLLAALVSPLGAQDTPLEAFRGNIAAIHARDRAAYLSHYLRSTELARVGPEGARFGYAAFAATAGADWPDTLVATHLQLVSLTGDVAYGAYRYRIPGERGVSERVFIRTNGGWKVAVTTAFPTAGVPPPPMALAGATVIDGTGAPPVDDAVVVMRDGRIECAGTMEQCPVADDVDVVDARGKWIMPGLVDAHVHFSQTGWVDGRPDALDLRRDHPYEQTIAWLRHNTAQLFRSYLCNGVTTVFDVGGYPWTWDLQAATADDPAAPRVYAAGPLLSTVDHWLNLPAHRQFIPMDDEVTVRQTVRAHAAWGAAAIKIWYIMRPGIDSARVSALVHATGDEARRAGLPLIVHATGLWEAKDAVRAGAQLLVHSVFDQPVDDEFLSLVRAGGTIYTPTLTVRDGYRQVRARAFERNRQPLRCVDPVTRAKVLATDTLTVLPGSPPPDPEAMRRDAQRAMRLVQSNLKRVHDAGIPVVLGTDAGNPLTLHGSSVFMELEAMQGAGLSPMDVLMAATRNGGAAVGRDDLGSVTPGAVADLLVLDADPLADVANVRRIALVVRGGEIYARRELAWDVEGGR